MLSVGAGQGLAAVGRVAVAHRRRAARRGGCPGSPVLVLSQYVEVAYADDLLADRRGGVGYLLKDRVADIGDFLDALRRVAGSGTVLDPEIVAQLVTRRGRAPLDGLTPRERDVLALMAEGRSNSAISPHARGHRRRRGEARPEHLHQARPAPGRGAAPTGTGGAGVPRRLG